MDFFVLGSQRCGTTWIHSALESTGACVLPQNKQTYFFDRNYDKGIDWYFGHYTDTGGDGALLRGEVATGYCLEGAFDRLADHFPDARVILTVREPVSRAFSNYQKRREDFGSASFEQALASNDDLVVRGLYGDMIERIYARFPEEQVLVVFFEDLHSDPSSFSQQILTFLGISASVDDALFHQNVNSSAVENVVRHLKRYRLYFLVNLVKKLGLTAFARRVLLGVSKKKRGDRPTIDLETRRRFDASNEKLRRYTGRGY